MAIDERHRVLDDVVGRESEVDRLTSFFDGDEGAAALWLEGAAGIGKTTLWHVAVELARERGYSVLACQPTAAETAFAFAAFGDILRKDAADVLPALPEPQRRALEVALALTPSKGATEPTVGLAFLSALQLLTARQPVLVAVDDFQWLDTASASVLQFAARRLAEEDVKFVIAARAEDDISLDGLELRPLGRVSRIRLGPLSLGALHRLILRRLDRPLSRPTLRKVHGASGGNPFYALEIARFLLERGSTLRAAEPLPIPHTLDELVRSRLDRLPRTVRRVLEATALVAEPTPALLAAACESEWKRSALDQGVVAGVLGLEGDRVRFTHPLFAAAVLSSVGPQRRRNLHMRLATIVGDPEERARHLALGSDGPDADVSESLERAAERAALRGAPSVAAELSELAAERTPIVDAEARWRRVIEAGLRHATAGDLARARSLLEPLTNEIPRGPLRARVLLNLADFHWDDAGEAIALAERALAEAGDDHTSRARIHMLLSSRALEAGEATAVAHIRAAHEAAVRAGDEELALLALANLVCVEVCVGDVTPGLLERAVVSANDNAARGGRIPHFESPHFLLGLALLGLGRFKRAGALFERARADSLAQDVTFAAACACEYLAESECRFGHLAAASLYASECSELYEQLGTAQQPGQLYAAALVDAYLGRVDEARSGATHGAAVADGLGQEFWSIANRLVLGMLELSLDNPAGAVESLDPPAHAADLWHLPSNCEFIATAIEAFAAVGDLDRAAELLDAFERRAQRLDSRWERAIRARCRGLLRAAEGDHDAALEAFDLALDEEELVTTPFEHARTLLARGVLQRRLKQRRAARESLGSALAAFEERGACLWAKKARTELMRIGGRRPSSNTLTPTERRVAELAAEGQANKEIAAALFVTVGTVEANLTRVYAKLGVRSRTQLARLLTGDGLPH